MSYKLAIFDMDGTILNTLEDLTNATNHSLKVFDMPERSMEEVRKFVGNGIHKLVERAVPEGSSSDRVEMVFNEFNSFYKDHSAVKTKPYDGIIGAISELRLAGVKTAVISNKADYAVKSLCDAYFEGLFDYSIGDREGQRRKPYPDTVFKALEYFNCEKKDAVYIGDSEVDIMTAENSGLNLIAVDWGFRDETWLRDRGATVLVHTAKELKTRILQ